MSSIFYSTITLLVIFSIYRPFVTKLDIVKYIALGGVSFLTPIIMNQQNKLTYNHQYTSSNATTLYSNVLINQSYDQKTYLVIDSIILSMISVTVISICGLFTRWHFPITFIQPKANPYLYTIMRNGVSMLFILVALLSQYSFPLTVIGLLWYISGPYFIKRWRSIGFTSIISSLICYFLLNSNTQQQKFSSILDCFFFTVILILVCNSFDHLDTILNTYPHLVTREPSLIQNATSLHYLNALVKLLFILPSETELDAQPIDDLLTAIEFLGPASRSWKTMAALFPVNLRQDLCLLYAFFRTADDLIDDAPTMKQSEKNLFLIRKFLKEVFLTSSVDWNYYRQVLPSEGHLAIFRNFVRISHYLCPRAMSELTNAWELDLRGQPVKKQKDLLNYAAFISGTFGELCTCVIMYKTGHGNWGPKNSPSRNEEVLLRARATGQCLQLVNIARDIIADSLVGRCYVPLQYMPYPAQRIYQLLKVARQPMQVGEGQLKTFCLRILNLADQISDKAQIGIDGLPVEVQDSIRAAFEIYMAIGPTLRTHPGFPLRAKVPKHTQQWIAFRCIYGFRGPVARAITFAFEEMVSFYTQLFDRISNIRKGPMTH